MGDIAEQARVSKQTIYTYFHQKEALFRGIVAQKCNLIWGGLEDQKHHREAPEHFLVHIGMQLMTCMVSPEALALQRVIIAESERFPELATAYLEEGPKRGKRYLEDYLQSQCDGGVLAIDDIAEAVHRFLGMLKEPFVAVGLMCHDYVPPTPEALQAHVEAVTRDFLALYAARSAG